MVERPRRARALVAFWAENERDERFLGLNLIDPEAVTKHIIRFRRRRILKSKNWFKCAAKGTPPREQRMRGEHRQAT